jgi:tetratricopeptide (TPR) repeat protein
VLQRAAQACYGLCFYVVKTLWPSDLSCHYLLELDFTPTAPIYVGAMLAVVGVTLLLAAFARRFPGAFTTWFVFGVLVSPVLGLRQSGAQKVADRYAHLCSTALSIALAAVVLLWIARLSSDGARRKAGALVLAVAVALGAALAAASNAQTRIWGDSERLFQRAVDVQPHNYFIAHNLAVMLFRKGDFERAAVVEKQSVDAHPAKGNETARETLATLYLRLGKPQLAERTWREALEWEPVPGDPRWRLGAAFWYPNPRACLVALRPLLLSRGAFDELLALYRTGLARRPDVLELYGDTAQLLIEHGRAQAALELWTKDARSHVPQAVLENGTGLALTALGRFDEAEQHLLRASTLDRTNREYVVDACELFFKQQRFEDVVSNLEQVLTLEPTHARAVALKRRAVTALGIK